MKRAKVLKVQTLAPNGAKVNSRNGKELQKPLHLSHRRYAGAGGGKGATGAVSATEAKDTLASMQMVAFKDAICEGEIEGFATPDFPLRDVILDGTPVENPDPLTVASLVLSSGNKVATTTSHVLTDAHEGRTIVGTNIPANTSIVTVEVVGSLTKVTLSKAPTASATITATVGGQLNFTDFDFYFVTGTQSQSYLPGFDAEANSFAIGVRLYHGTASSDGTAAAWIHTVTNEEADEVRIDVRFPRLEQQVTSGDKIGDTIGTTVRIKIDTNGNGGGWVNKVDDTLNEKTSNPYVRTYKIPTAGIEFPIEFRVVRVTADSTLESVSNQTWIDAITEVIYGKLSHPNTAMGGAIISAQQFPSVPTRGYRIKGRKVLIPVNYTPWNPTTGAAAIYSGTWNGVFKTGWTQNPAWGWYDLAVNNRFGLGNYLPAANMDKWATYAMAQYNDVLVSNGFGGMEPRFWSGLYVQQRVEALKLMTDVAAMSRAVMLFASGILQPIQDRPGSATMMFSPANVINGQFSYSGTSRRARHTVALVTWNDQSDNGIAKPEYVESDQQTIAKYGIVQTEVTAIGCVSRGVAHRYGKHLLAAEATLTDTISFEAGQEGFFAAPGKLIQIQDPFRAGAEFSGLIVSRTTSAITLDRPVTLLSGRTYFVSYMRPTDSALITVPVLNSPGTTSVISITTLLTAPPDVGTLWQLAADNLQPAVYRVLVMRPKDLATCAITALVYNESIYGFVEDNLNLEDPPVSILPPPGVLPCGPMTFQDVAVVTPSGLKQQIRAIWGPSKDSYLSRYELQWRVNGSLWSQPITTAIAETNIDTLGQGTYEFSVVAVNVAGQKSRAVVATHIVDAGSPVPGFTVGGLELAGQGNDTNFQQRDAKFVWRLNSPVIPLDLDEINDGIDDPTFQSFHVTIWKDDKPIWGPFYPKEPTYIFTEEMNAEAMKPLPPTPTFRIEVRALDTYSRQTDAAVLTVTNPPPAAPVNFLAISAFKTAFLSWLNPRDVDLNLIEVWRSLTSEFPESGLPLATVSKDVNTFTDGSVLTGIDYWYFLRAQDTFGNYSAATAGAKITPGTVTATDIEDFAIDESKMFSQVVVLKGAVWYNDTTYDPDTDTRSPLVGSVAWNAHTVYWKGAAYPIAAGSTTLKYIYWRGLPPLTEYGAIDNNPVDSLIGWSNNQDFQIAVNNGGAYELAWYGFANAVIGSAYIKDAAITSAKIALLAVDDARIASAGISKLAAGSVTAETLKVGLGLSVLNPNASFEQDLLGWSLFGPPASIDSLMASDGFKSLKCATSGVNSGATTKAGYLPPVVGGSVYSLSTFVHVTNVAVTLRIGIRESVDGVTFTVGQWIILDAAASTIGIPANVWTKVSKKFTLAAGTRFVSVYISTGALVDPAGKVVHFDNVSLIRGIGSDGIVEIGGGIVKTGSVESNNPAFTPGPTGVGYQITNEGLITAKNIILRDPIIYQNLLAPTFTNDYGGAALASRQYTDNDQISVRAHCATGKRIRYEIGKAVTSASPFWDWYTGAGGHDPGDPLQPGVGPSDFAGYILSDGAGGTPAFAHTSAFHVRTVSELVPGDGLWQVLGPEVIITFTWVGAIATILPTPIIYRESTDSGTRGSASYQIRARCLDTLAALHVSVSALTGTQIYQDGKSIWYAYATGAVLEMDVGKNVYFYASRAGFLDSAKAVFSNTLSGVPVADGSGGTTVGTRVLP